MELSSNLKLFKALHLTMPLDNDCDPFPEGTNLEKLPEFFFQFNVDFPISMERSAGSYFKRRLVIEKCNFPFTMPIKKLFHVSDYISLDEIKDLDNIIPDLYGESCTDDLKCIYLESCENVSCLVKKTRDEDATQSCVTSGYDDLIGQRKTTKEIKFFSQLKKIYLIRLTNLKLLFDCPLEYISLHNLGYIEIAKCSSLLTLFPLTVAQGVSNLRGIKILNCDSLMVVISAEDEQIEDSETEVGIHDDAVIVFPSLTHIHLEKLPHLKSFYSGDSTIKFPSLKNIEVKDCHSMKKWGYGVHDIYPTSNLGIKRPSICSINDPTPRGSSLWETDTLRHHYCPPVSRFVLSLENDLTVRSKTTEVAIKDFSSGSYATIFKEEIRRRVKQVPLAFYKAVPTSLFSETDFAGWVFQSNDNNKDSQGN